ncbi:MAG: hypothetical protein AAF360_12995 [Pseudomonadota bacterium]
MKRHCTRTASLLALALGFCGTPAPAADFEPFRACVAAADETAVTATYHHCTAPLASHCGASATAADAVACIRAVRDEFEAEIASGVEALAERTEERRADVEWYLADGRGSGESSCAVMASQDQARGVAVGQRAVNGAFCELIISGDVLALLIRLSAAP